MLSQMFLYSLPFLIFYIGGLILSSIINLESGNVIRNLFYKLFLGSLITILGAALIITNFRSSFILVFIPIVYFLFKEKIVLKSINFNLNEFILFLIVLFVNYLGTCILFKYYGQQNNIFVFPDIDMLFYGDLSNFILKSHSESVFTNWFDHNFSYSPYHYGDIYLNIVFSYFTKITILLSYKISLFLFSIILYSMGLYSYLYDKTKKTLKAVFFLLITLMATMWSLSAFIDSNFKLENYIGACNLLSFLKLCLPSMLILCSTLLYLDNKKKLAFYILNITSIIYSNLIFGVLIIDFLYLVFLLKNKEIVYSDVIIYFLMYFCFFLFIYSYASNIVGPIKFSISDRIDFILNNTIYRSIGGIVSVLPLYFLFCITDYSNKKKWVLNVISGLFSLAFITLFFHSIDSGQIFTNIVMCCYPLCFGLCIVSICNNLFKWIIPVFFLFFILYNQYYNRYTLQGVQITNFDNVALNKILLKSRNDKVLFLRESTSYIEDSYFFNSNFYRMGYWISTIAPNMSFISISDVDALKLHEKTSNENISSIDRVYINMSKATAFTKYFFDNSYTFDKIDLAKGEFIEENKIDLILMEKGVPKSFIVEKIIDSCYNSDKSEVLYLLN